MAVNTVIATNVMALSANRHLGSVGRSQSKANERLSSGKKINTAADDAAGLAISQKMKAQIRGLDMAEKNSEDAISLIQTAEGSVGEMQSMLQRMRELSIQAANDTNTTEERTKMANEMVELIDEIDSMAGRTEFNGQKLIDGEFSGVFQIGANSGQSISIEMSKINAEVLGDESIIESKLQQQAVLGGKTINADGTITTTNDNVSSLRDAYAEIVATINSNDDDISFDNGKINNAVGATKIAIQNIQANKESVPEKVMEAIEKVDAAVGNILKLAVDAADAQDSATALSKLKELKDIFESREFVNLMESTYDLINAQMSSLAEMRTTLQGFIANPEGVNLSHQYFTSFVETLDVALSEISDQRAKLGASQNRIEYTINNLQVSSENLSAANSRIEDADMAKEMMNLTQANVLQQAAISMLAQANQAPNNITQLLG